MKDSRLIVVKQEKDSPQIQYWNGDTWSNKVTDAVKFPESEKEFLKKTYGSESVYVLNGQKHLWNCVIQDAIDGYKKASKIPIRGCWREGEGCCALAAIYYKHSEKLKNNSSIDIREKSFKILEKEYNISYGQACNFMNGFDGNRKEFIHDQAGYKAGQILARYFSMKGLLK